VSASGEAKLPFSARSRTIASANAGPTPVNSAANVAASAVLILTGPAHVANEASAKMAAQAVRKLVTFIVITPPMKRGIDAMNSVLQPQQSNLVGWRSFRRGAKCP
jgi:hypothetical protein